jgi:hypothetical protein
MYHQLNISDLSADASQVARGTNIANIASSAANVGIGVFSVISNIQDSKQRALFEANFRSLSAEQQRKIDQQVSGASSESAKLNILANSLTQLGVARITSQANIITEEERKKRNELILIGGFVIATGLIITYIVIKKF